MTVSQNSYQYALGDRYDYEAGDSENDYIKRNATRTDDLYFRIHSPIYAIATALRGRSQYKKDRARYERAKDEAAKRERERDYYGKMYAMDKEQWQEDDLRDAALDAVDDPNSIAVDDEENERDYQANIGNALAGIGEQYEKESRGQTLAAVKRGVLGGSNDIEQQTDLAAGMQSRVMDASQQALARRADSSRRRSNARSSLRRSILVGDPAQAAAWTERARSEGAQADRDARMMDYMNAFNQIRAQQAETNSRLLGSTASFAADSYRMDQQAKGDGNVGLY